MSWVNYDDVLDQLRAGGLLDRHGNPLSVLEVDTPRPVRGRVEGEDREPRGWYWLHTIVIDGERYIVGAFGCYHGTDAGKRKIELRRNGQRKTLTPEQRAAIAERQRANQARMKAMREADAERAARAAQLVWRRYLPDGQSDYLQRKGVGAHGVRFAPVGNGTFAVPMMDPAGKIWGLQIIRGKNRGKKLEKQYWPAGVMVQGHYHLIGGVPDALILVAEGYATAATLFESTGIPAAVAFDAGNLVHVAKALSKTYRRARILVCADDDYLTPGNPGVTAAQAAAHAVDGAWIAPVFHEQRPQDRKGPTDFNDLQALEGRAIVRAQIEARLRELGWSMHVRRGGFAGRGDGGIPSVIQIEDAIDRFWFIYGGRGTVFDAVEHMLVPLNDVKEILPEHGWRDLRTRKRVARIDEVGFDPAGTDPRIKCNLWGGWPTRPKSGSCDRLLELLEYLCAEERNHREIYQWVLKWLAYPIQHPGAKMRTALVFHGPQGTGKNLFFEAVMAIYGEYGRIIDQSAIEDKFNDWASRKLFLIADEVVARQELFHVKNKLKSLITGEWIRINPKNVAAHDERNHVNVVFLSNEPQPLVLEKDDRRFVVIWTPPKADEAFYEEVRAEIDSGGVAALHQYLLDLDLGDFNEHSKPPMTEAKEALIDISMDSVERFVSEWMAGEITFNGKVLPFCPAGSADLYAAYTRWCRGAGVLKPRESGQFHGAIAKRQGWVRGLKDRLERIGGTAVKRQRMIVPSERDLAAASARSGLEDLRQKPGETQTEWLTRCFFTFQEALADAV